MFDAKSNYNKAIRLLESYYTHIEPTRHYDDIWSFCLNSRRIRFYCHSDYQRQKTNNSKDITPPHICISPYNLFNNQNPPFWFVFERRPIFNYTNFNNDPESIKDQTTPLTNATVLGRIKFFRGVHMKLTYGALTSMNEYYYHPWYDFAKRSEWTVSHISIIKKQQF